MTEPALLARARTYVGLRPVADWRDVLRYAWSVRLMILAALFSGAEVALPFLDGWLPISPGLFGLLSFLTTVAAFIARFVAQKSLDRTPEPDWENGESE